VQVREHSPEPPHARGVDSDPEAGQIGAQEMAYEVLAPGARDGVVGREVARRESAASPEPRDLPEARADLLEQQWRHVDDREPPRERLRLAKQRERRRPQEQEATGPPVGVDLAAQLREQTGRVLDIVEDDEPAPVRAQEQARIGETCEVRRALEVQVDAAGATGRDGAGQRRLACLPWAEDRDGRAPPRAPSTAGSAILENIIAS